MVSKNLWAAFIISLCGFQFGYNSSIVSGVLPFISKTFSLTFLQQGKAASAIVLGAILGTICGGSLSGLKRTMTLQIADILFLIGGISTSLAQNISIFYTGRILQGIALGAVGVIVPIYLLEIAPSQKHGTYMSISNLFLVSGGLIAYGANFFLASYKDNWRLMIGAGVIPAIIQFFLLFLIPETKKNHLETSKPSWRLLLLRENRQLLLIGIALCISQQFIGCNAIFYFAPQIFAKAGFLHSNTPFIATIGIGTLNIFVTIFSTYIIDKIPRKTLLFSTTCGLIASLFLLSLTFHLEGFTGKFLTLFSIAAYLIFFGIGMGPIPPLISSEMYPSFIKAQALSISGFFGWGANYFVSLSFLSLANYLSFSGIFLCYAFIGMAALLFIWKKVPETKTIVI